MSDLKTFFLILFLSKSVILTPDPISVGDGEVELSLGENISAITTGATLQIDVSTMIDLDSKSGVVQIRKVAEAQFPSGTISAILVNDENSMIPLTYFGGILVNDGSVRLSLEGKIPLETEWNKVVLKSDLELREVSIVWLNAKH